MAFAPGSRQFAWHWALSAIAAALCAAPLHAQNLVQITEQAQAYDAAWQSARAQWDASIAQSAQTQAGLLPQLGLQAGTQYSESRTRGNFIGSPARLDARQDTASLQASQPLYRPANLASYRQGQHGLDVAQARIDAAYHELLVRSAQTYFQVLAAADHVRLVRAQQVAVSEQLAFAQRNFEIGTATVTDSREAQARFDLVRAQEIAAANDLRVAHAQLEQLVGQSIVQPWGLAQPVQLPALEPAALDAWLEMASVHSPVLRQARTQVHIAQLETHKAQAGHKPTVDLQASYGTQRNPDGTPSAPYRSNSTAGSVGVVVQIPLFAGFAVQNRVKETLSLETKAHADLEDAQRQVAQRVRTAFFGLQSAYGQVQALEAAVASSQSALDANRLGYEVGVRINMDVLNAQSQLYQSQRDLAQARYQLLLAHLQLRQAAGTLSLQDVHTINQSLSPVHAIALQATGTSAR